MKEPFPIAVDPEGELVEVPAKTLTRHALVTGTTGWGKSGFLHSVVLQVVARQMPVNVVLVDAKGGTAEELRDVFLPALVAHGSSIDPRSIVSVAPFGSYGVPLNPLHPIAGVQPEVQANLVCLLVGGLVSGVGQRMLGLLAWLCRCVIARKGTLLDVLRLLQDESYRRSFAADLPDPELQHYLAVTFENEPRTSVESLRSRLEWLLLLPPVRGMLCAEGSLSGADLIESPISIIDLGGAPQGFSALTRFVGGLLFGLLTAAVLSRRVDADTRPTLLVCDEWQRLVVVSADEFEDLLSLARFKKVALWLANQTLGQLGGVGQALVQSLTTNIALGVSFRPSPEDIKHARDLLRITGACVDLERPDRLLTGEQERKRLMARLARLPMRHALLTDHVSGTARIVRSLDVPYERAMALASQLPRETREAFRVGRFGVPVDALASTPAGRPAPMPALDSEALQAMPPRAGRPPRSKLKLP